MAQEEDVARKSLGASDEVVNGGVVILIGNVYTFCGFKLQGVASVLIFYLAKYPAFLPNEVPRFSIFGRE